MVEGFLENTTVIDYSDKNYQKTKFLSLNQVDLTPHENGTKWINTYGLEYQSDFKAIILNNK